MRATVEEPIGGLSTDDWGSLAYKVALVVFIGGAVLMLFRERPVAALEAALFWVVVGFVLVFAYTYRDELRDVGDRVMAQLVPGRAAIRGERTVEICADAAAISRWRRRSTARGSPWRSTPAPAPSC